MKKVILSGLIILTLTGAFLLFPKNKNKAELDNHFQEKEVQKVVQSSVMKTNYIDVSPQEAKKLIMEIPEIVIIDVSPKYDEGHLPGAINYYLGDGSLDAAIPNLDKKLTYLIYCHVDSASIAGAKKLIEAGFENVYRLEGNYAAWLELGYEVEK